MLKLLKTHAGFVPEKNLPEKNIHPEIADRMNYYKGQVDILKELLKIKMSNPQGKRIKK